jgi:hypothetical protein
LLQIQNGKIHLSSGNTSTAQPEHPRMTEGLGRSIQWKREIDRVGVPEGK